MEKELRDIIIKRIKQFHLPKYEEIPDVGLYLDQTVKYINSYFVSIPNVELTSSMVSNYVKKGLIDRPIRKVYHRDQICYLFFITIAKTVLTMENIQILFDVQKKVYDERTAYEYLRQESDNVIEYVFSMKEDLDIVGYTNTKEKDMLRNTIIAMVHKIYLELCFEVIRDREL